VISKAYLTHRNLKRCMLKNVSKRIFARKSSRESSKVIPKARDGNGVSQAASVQCSSGQGLRGNNSKLPSVCGNAVERKCAYCRLVITANCPLPINGAVLGCAFYACATRKTSGVITNVCIASIKNLS